MKKFKKLPESAFEPMDDYERQLIKDIENDEFVEVPNQEEEIKKVRAYAKYTLEKMKKEKRLTLRLQKEVLEKIQEKALDAGIPYQTLIGSILHQFAKGKLRISL